MQKDRELLLAFYGDDFTGSTDALEFMSRAGAKTVLFLDTPSEERLSAYENLDAVGIAGMTRAMVPQAMREVLYPAFEVLKSLRPLHVHYKVCSTFDSSPTIGSIGQAIDVGAAIFQSVFIPLLVGAPNLGRYCAFGNLFAQMGIGSKGDIYRLDRHPSMMHHPITPADESDLRLHLAKQTTKSSGLFDLRSIEKHLSEAQNDLQNLIDKGNEIILFDAIYESQMSKIGHLIDRYASIERPLFSVGSSGVEKALGDNWQNVHLLTNRTSWQKVGKASAMLVVSGSCSPVTAEQINWALLDGFEEVVVETTVLEAGNETLIRTYADQIINALKAGKHVVIHTCKGPDDPRIQASNDFFQKQGAGGLEMRSMTARIFGHVLGSAARKALEEVKVDRLVIAGGDTSSYVARELGIEAVEMIAPIFTGAPLCKAYAPGSPVDGLEVNLKGGQVGDESYFSALLNGKI